MEIQMKNGKLFAILFVTGAVAILSLSVFFMSNLSLNNVSAEITEMEKTDLTPSESKQGSLNTVYYGRYAIEDGYLTLSMADKEYWHFTYLNNELTLIDNDGVLLFDAGERFLLEELDLKQLSTDRHPSLDELLTMPFD